MQIVIDIPHFIYEQILKNHISKKTIAKIFSNSTPLPQNHGRLVDADKLIVWCKSNDDKLMSEYYINHIVEESTIIEADKGDKE